MENGHRVIPESDFGGLHGTAEVGGEYGLDSIVASALAHFLSEQMTFVRETAVMPTPSNAVFVVFANRMRLKYDLYAHCIQRIVSLHCVQRVCLGRERKISLLSIRKD